MAKMVDSKSPFWDFQECSKEELFTKMKGCHDFPLVIIELCHKTDCKYYNENMDLNCGADEDTCERCNFGKGFEQEMLCPKCKSEMKEYVNRYRCRNIDCRNTIDKYFKIKGDKYK
jgi:hypothetical protein